MRVVIAGSSGLIGSALTASLTADGHAVVPLVRRPPNPPSGRVSETRWDPAHGHLPASALDGADAVVNLAGAGVGDHRWTRSYRRQIRDSRVLTTATLATTTAALTSPPPVFVAGSAIGYYGETGDTPTDESAPPGKDFLADVCQEWEAAADPARKAGIRVVHPRFGIVVASHGGAFGRLLPPARFGLGGRLGTGRQYWSYISLTDTVRALRHIIAPTTPAANAPTPSAPDTSALTGPVNVTTAHPARNREITADIGRALGRPMLFTVPAPALRLAIGGFAEGTLMSQRIIPARLLASGFIFTHPTFPESLASALTVPNPSA
ncbi:MAG TPA: TIGR01777 family oxidoreductase [Actinocrinis sp.]|uniref:TIGR01777 family oxidoreductase n=1 Tax=Actinocrinis sp. TaxID=1920516 RepID=UPI002DDD7521|nr:TIGR01777 family oxidoreductase [Actinocrinis sp.]HEV2347358.1 TIGR01777 family oxidoreductase [Actinocrinis sp.]